MLQPYCLVQNNFSARVLFDKTYNCSAYNLISNRSNTGHVFSCIFFSPMLQFRSTAPENFHKGLRIRFQNHAFKFVSLWRNNRKKVKKYTILLTDSWKNFFNSGGQNFPQAPKIYFLI